MKYIILVSDSTKGLTIEVTKAITDGYIPQGGISVTYAFNGKQGAYGFTQAMIKE